MGSAAVRATCATPCLRHATRPRTGPSLPLPHRAGRWGRQPLARLPRRGRGGRTATPRRAPADGPYGQRLAAYGRRGCFGYVPLAQESIYQGSERTGREPVCIQLRQGCQPTQSLQRGRKCKAFGIGERGVSGIWQEASPSHGEGWSVCASACNQLEGVGRSTWRSSHPSLHHSSPANLPNGGPSD